MSYSLMRTDLEIDNQRNLAVEQEEEGGSSVPGMTYEQGVRAGIDWLIGNVADLPLET